MEKIGGVLKGRFVRRYEPTCTAVRTKRFAMMERFQNKYRTRSPRAKWWDYSHPGSYFITICTKNREHLFGQIIDKKMIFTNIGEIVLKEWDKSFLIRSELKCNAFILMPDHLHAIVQIINLEPDGAVDSHSRANPQPSTGVAYRPPKSISSFVAGFKSSATKQINEFRNTPGLPVWQSKFMRDFTWSD